MSKKNLYKLRITGTRLCQINRCTKRKWPIGVSMGSSSYKAYKTVVIERYGGGKKRKYEAARAVKIPRPQKADADATGR